MPTARSYPVVSWGMQTPWMQPTPWMQTPSGHVTSDACWEANTLSPPPPPPRTKWHTGIKTIACLKLRLRAVKIYWHVGYRCSGVRGEFATGWVWGGDAGSGVRSDGTTAGGGGGDGVLPAGPTRRADRGPSTAHRTRHWCNDAGRVSGV